MAERSGPGGLLAGIEGLVCDMDGVLYRGDEAVPGAGEAISFLRARRVRVLFCTNNSRYTVEHYAERLAGMGLPVSPEEILTSGVVTAEVLAGRGFKGKAAMVLGGEGVRAALTDAGLDVTRAQESSPADVVVVGLDPEFDYAKLAKAAAAVRDGAVFVATNADATFPAPGGLLPGAGSILAAVEAASGRKAEVMGKPHPPMTAAIARRFEGLRRVAIVGDRADTDLVAGEELGWKKVLVLSGVTSPHEAEAVAPQPDAILPSLADIRTLL